MDFHRLKKLVRQGEGQHLEFKLKASHPEKIVREMVAFANSKGGGKVLIGISDNKKIEGLRFPSEEKYALEQAIQRYCHPSFDYSIEEITLQDDKVVLIYNIYENKDKLSYIKEEIPFPQQIMYVRSADKSLKASKEVREVLKGRRKNRDFKFEYGDKETLLFKYLEKNKIITLKEFMNLASISKRIASRTLVLLVLAGMLEIYPKEREDEFCLRVTY